MSALTETSLTSMNAAFPTAPEQIHGIPTHLRLLLTYDAPHVAMVSDPEDICLSYNEHAVTCGFIWSLFVRHQQRDSRSQRKLMMFLTSPHAHQATSVRVYKPHMPATEKLKWTSSPWIQPSLMFCSQILQKQFLRQTSWSTWSNQTLYFCTYLTGSSQSTGK